MVATTTPPLHSTQSKDRELERITRNKRFAQVVCSNAAEITNTQQTVTVTARVNYALLPLGFLDVKRSCKR